MLNVTTIMGRLTRDPELRRTGSGIAVASFTLAVDRDYSSKENSEKETDFIDCVAWRQTGEFVSKYFTKGRMAVVVGRLQTRTWTDKEGNKRKSMEVNADNVYFGDSKRSDNHGGNYQQGGYNAPQQDGNNYAPKGYQGNGAPAQNAGGGFAGYSGAAPANSAPAYPDNGQNMVSGFGGFPMPGNDNYVLDDGSDEPF